MLKLDYSIKHLSIPSETIYKLHFIDEKSYLHSKWDRKYPFSTKPTKNKDIYPVTIVWTRYNTHEQWNGFQLLKRTC